MSSLDEQIDAAVARRIETYHGRYASPSAQTIKRWQRQEARRLAQKGQLVLPFAELKDEAEAALAAALARSEMS